MPLPDILPAEKEKEDQFGSERNLSDEKIRKTVPGTPNNEENKFDIKNVRIRTWYVML